MSESAPGLRIQNIACTRGYRELFTDLNLLLESGQILRVEGENGSGKTSLLRILAGLAQPESGDVLWNGLGIEHVDACYSHDLLYLGHKPGIKFELTPVENLCMFTSLFGTKSENGIEDALYQLGLYGFEDVPCSNLSAGQKRRVALAQLLMSKARLWILDEPYTSLDVAAIAFLESVFKKHVQNGGMLIITSHQPITVEGCLLKRLVLPSTVLEEVH
ncbi:MAG: cytochrome c biogenesis heme-transporting ATPase CcmA [Gammaproteobacteria bacterium]|nr:cytochrome c biogenesis heme-transporting ATPase CcmA [Gammaproteobacteria bacterium]